MGNSCCFCQTVIYLVVTFFYFIFKQWIMEYSNTERGTDGEQIQITDFQSHPNISDWAGWGNKTRL